MEVAGNTIKLLRDMLKEVDVVTNPGALNDPTIDELSAQCAQMRPRVVALVQSVSDEALMMRALSLNDELTEVAEKRDALKAAASADRDTRAAIVASMREEEVAAERHGSGAGAGSNAVGDLVDLLGGDSFVVEDPPRPGKDKKGVEGHAGGVVDPFDVSVSVGNGVGGGAGGGARRVDPLDELLAPAPAMGQSAMGQSAYDPFAASAPASVQPPAQQNYYPPVSNNTGAVADPFASGVTNPFAQQQQARAPMGSPPMRSVQSPMGAMNVNPLFQQQAQVQQPAQGGMGSLPPVGASSAPYDPFAASPPPQQQRGNNPFAR